MFATIILPSVANATSIAPSQDTTVYRFEEVAVKPEYPSGINKLMQFVKNRLKYPMEAGRKNIQGKVVVQFTVKADGKIGDIKVLNSLHPLIEAVSK
jgi:outer membrane biosynthesis protein TonB